MRRRANIGWGMMAAAVCAVCASGCLRYTRADSPETARFDLLYQRDLSGFEQNIAIAEHLGERNGWVRLAQGWLELANCRPVDRRSFRQEADGRAPFLHATVALEDSRRRWRLAEELAGGRPPGDRLLSERIRREGFFDRTPDETPSDVIEWPQEQEAWADEVPAAVEVESDCEELTDQVRDKRADKVHDENEDNTTGEEEPGRPWTIHDWRVDLLASIDHAVDRWIFVPEAEQTGALAATHYRVRVYGAVFAYRLALAYDGVSLEGRKLPRRVRRRLQTDRLWKEVARMVDPVIGGESDARSYLSEGELAEANYLAALVRERRGDHQVALALIERAMKLGLAEANRWPARYLRLRLLTRQGRWSEAVELADQLPPRGSRYFVPYGYRVGVALRQEGRDDRFMGVIKTVFRDRTPESGPFARALYGESLQLLASFPFEERVVEVLEEMGNRSRLYRRIEQLARVALKRGRPENAAAAARWLLGHHEDARFRPRYRSLLALVAFQKDEPAEFRRQIDEIARRPDSLLAAIPQRRRASFFAPADNALARILRLTLPMMAEWGDTPPAEERRERWLEIIVDETQTFLRTTRESIARPSLVELYRLASAQLEDHPRGYAERVGDEEPAALVLGTVEVKQSDLRDDEPPITADFAEPYSLTLIPRGQLPPARWQIRWESDDEEGADA